MTRGLPHGRSRLATQALICENSGALSAVFVEMRGVVYALTIAASMIMGDPSIYSSRCTHLTSQARAPDSCLTRRVFRDMDYYLCFDAIIHRLSFLLPLPLRCASWRRTRPPPSSLSPSFSMATIRGCYQYSFVRHIFFARVAR